MSAARRSSAARRVYAATQSLGSAFCRLASRKQDSRARLSVSPGASGTGVSPSRVSGSRTASSSMALTDQGTACVLRKLSCTRGAL